MDYRRELYDLEPGVPTWLNGVPVVREPCAGFWFRVGAHEDYPDVHYQRLGLGDAVQRVRSGHFPRLTNAPPPLVRCVQCDAFKPDRWRGSFSWCLTCARRVCLDCHNEHGDAHAGDEVA